MSLPAILDLETGDDLEAPDCLLGELATVGLDEADDDVLALGAAVVGLAEHRERLAAPRCGPEEHPEVATRDLGCRRDLHRAGGDRVAHAANDARATRPINASAGEAGLLSRRVRG